MAVSLGIGGPGAERLRALRLLAGSPLGCTEAIMLAHGFMDEMLTGLVRDGDRGDRACRQAADQGDVAEDHRRRAAGARRDVVAAQPQGTEAQ